MTQFFRRVIKIRADDSPNVLEKRDDVVPGVLTWSEYQHRRATWDKVRQCVGLDAEFWTGADVLMFPPEWLNRAEQVAATRQPSHSSMRRWIGCDPAEGGDKSAWSVIDQLGLVELISTQTPDTTVVTARTLALIHQYGVSPVDVVFDRGGGGKEHADRLRAQGYPVRTVAFGESLVLQPKRGMRLFPEKVEAQEERYAYKNRRAEMYGTLREILDPANAERPQGFGIPARYADLRHELSPIPLTHDPEGRLELLPKHKRSSASGVEEKRKTLVDLIGHSPDLADSLVLAVHAMTHKGSRATAGAL